MTTTMTISLDNVASMYGYSLCRHRELAFHDSRTGLPEPKCVDLRAVRYSSYSQCIEITHEIDMTPWGGDRLLATCRIGVDAKRGFALWHVSTDPLSEWIISEDDPEYYDEHLLDSLDTVCGWLEAVAKWAAPEYED